jgi:hypothetical protein
MPARRLTLVWMLLVPVCAGCHELDLFPFHDKEEAQEKARQANVRKALHGEDGRSKLIGEYVKIGDNGYVKVQGVGLVDRLDGTGEDPPASFQRTLLLEDLRRHEIKDPNALISSSKTALVIVTAHIPPICKKGERIDVEITVPEGSEALSLAGGWLMPCHLREHAQLEGQIREGREICIATGPILIDALGEEVKDAAGAHRRGRIPGGAIYNGNDRLLGIQIASEYRTVRMASQISNSIGKRFHDYDENGIQRPLAKAKTNERLELIVHDRYRDNYPRYLQCIRHLSLTESPVERHMRLQQLESEIEFGPTAERAALQLEAIGPDAIPVLKKGLASPDLEARFHSGVALAYLADADGVPALQEAADKEPAFRVYALAALSAMPDGSAAKALRDLMNHDSIETRYGAFRAYTTMAPNDPFVKGIEMSGHFSLHPVESTGTPLVHITRYKKAEIVVFGAEQEFLPPLMLRAGTRIILQSAAQRGRVLVKRIAPGETMQQRESSYRVTEVIKAISDLGGTYPDVVEMLVQAERQHNLPGKVAIDVLPAPGRTYERPAGDRVPPPNVKSDSAGSSVTVGGAGLLPNLFDEKPAEVNVPTYEAEIPTNPEKTLLKE